MASTYSDRLKLELMATGANANTWGTNTNNNLEVLDAFSAGYLSKSVAGGANITLTTANASDTAESSNKTIELTGALTGDIVVFIPAVESEYNFFNNTTGSQTLTIAATGHTANGVQITQGAKTTVFCDGTSDFNVEIVSSTDLGSLTGTLPQVSGANLTNLNASNVASGTLPDGRFPATLPALNGSALTALNADNIASGTLGSARLPTVPTTKGGTGLTSIGSAGQVIQVNSGASALEFATPAGGLTNFQIREFTSTTTYTPTSGTAFIRVYCVGGGGGGGGTNPGNQNAFMAGGGMGGNCGVRDYDSTELGADAAITIGAAGSGGPNNHEGGQGGQTSFNPAGTGVTLSADGGVGAYSVSNDEYTSMPKDKTTSVSNAQYVIPGGYPLNGGEKRRHGSSYYYSGSGGNSAFGFGGNYKNTNSSINADGNAGSNGGGGGGALNRNFAQNRTGGAGGAGIVIIEEYQ